ARKVPVRSALAHARSGPMTPNKYEEIDISEIGHGKCARVGVILKQSKILLVVAIVALLGGAVAVIVLVSPAHKAATEEDTSAVFRDLGEIRARGMLNSKIVVPESWQRAPLFELPLSN